MKRVSVKVCGITNVGDARACADVGVEMIGLNFSPRSLRCISLETAVPIIDAARAKSATIKIVGVFVDQPIAFVRETATKLGLDAVQFHGEESPAYLRELAHPFAIKAFRVGSTLAIPAADYPCATILLDTWRADTPGGTGETFPWALAASFRSPRQRLILAGGLTSDNVADAIRTVRPFAVDVCSGVETAPGKKDESKVRGFVDAVRATAKMSAIL